MKHKILWLLFITIGFSQYSEEWQISQDQYENGIVYFDMNEDGYSEITKTFWNSITVFDGANDYAIIWSIYDESTENISIWDMYDFEGNGEKLAIITGSNFYNSVDFHLLGYTIFGTSPVWMSESYDGSISFLNAAELDQDVGKELVFGINRYDDVDSSYFHSLRILDGLTGAEEFVLQEQPGYLSGPYVGDLDGDGFNEILLNIYDYKDENYYMSVWSHNGGTQSISKSPITDRYSVSQNYPNPFNPNTVLPITLHSQSKVSIHVMNAKGQQVQSLVNGSFSAGRYQFSWNGQSQSGVPQSSGVYFFLIDIDGNQLKRPMVLMK